MVANYRIYRHKFMSTGEGHTGYAVFTFNVLEVVNVVALFYLFIIFSYNKVREIQQQVKNINTNSKRKIEL